VTGFYAGVAVADCGAGKGGPQPALFIKGAQLIVGPTNAGYGSFGV
jgi:hypothetical protein